jgi:hypothetical protein
MRKGDKKKLKKRRKSKKSSKLKLLLKQLKPIKRKRLKSMMVHQVTMKVAILGQIPILKIPMMKMLRNWPTIKKPKKKRKAKNDLQECNWPNKNRTRNEKKSELSKTKD